MDCFQPFVMERWMSQFEQDVDYNLSESGVHPILLKDLLAYKSDSVDHLLSTPINYPHVNGIPELRAHIANLYEGAKPENVLVTVGAIEANYISTRTLLSEGDGIAIMLPNYMQIWGIAKNHGFEIQPFYLNEAQGWAPDMAQLESTVNAKTKMIAVCNPNNPTGRILTEPEMDAIVACAERTGAWILSDEVYRGADRVSEAENPSFFGRYDKVLAIGSMSKAYGLPGLRVGWVVGPQDTIDQIWARHEYITISATMLSNQLAAIALSPEVRPKLIKRARDYIREGYREASDNVKPPKRGYWAGIFAGLFGRRSKDIKRQEQGLDHGQEIALEPFNQVKQKINDLLLKLGDAELTLTNYINDNK